MNITIPATMEAMAIEQFGGIEQLEPKSLAVPEVGPDEILMRVEAAGVGVWDEFEREGGFAELLDIEPKFPYVLGSDGAGTVVDVGSQVSGFEPGDRVFACSLANPKGGFYAQYATAKAEYAALVPEKLTTEQAGALMVDGVTALYGLEREIGLKEGDSILIFGASGGIGHLAVQFAKRMGVRVFAVASGDDGVALVKKLGADAVVDGHRADLTAALHEFSLGTLDSALVTAGGDTADEALTAVRDGGHVAYPNGVEPKPNVRPKVNSTSYDGTPDPQIIERMLQLIDAGPFDVHIAQTFRLEQAATAQRALKSHYLGKFVLVPS